MEPILLVSHFCIYGALKCLPPANVDQSWWAYTAYYRPALFQPTVIIPPPIVVVSTRGR